MVVKKITVIFMFLYFINIVSAANVGVVVEFPDSSIFTECISINDDVNGYEVLEKTSLNVEWSEAGPFGHAWCKINGVGEDVKGAGCEWGSEYWAFLISDGSDWQYSPVGLDGGESCWNEDLFSYDGHYCAKDKDVIGFAHGEYGTRPVFYTYEEICQSRIDFEDITIKVNGQKDTGTIDVFPDSKLEAKIKVKNLFENIEIKNIEVIGTIENIDDGDDLEDDSSRFDLEAGETETVELEFEIPFDIEDGDYNFKIKATGKDTNNVEHTAEEEFTVRVKKDKHDVVFRHIETKTDLKCSEQTSLNIKIANTGKEEEDVILKITSNELGINLQDSFTLSEDPYSEDNEYSKAYTIKIPDNQKEGAYTLTVRAEYGDESAEEKIDLNVVCEKENKLVLKEKSEDANPTNLTVTKTEPKVTYLTSTEQKKPNNNYFGTLILAVEATAIILCLLIIFRLLK